MQDELDRFLSAQQEIYVTALAELRAGRKRSHWMWFVFPQLAGLGHSATARYYAIASLDEARRYLAHAILGARLRECTEAMLALAGQSANEVLGYPDDLKFRSCMTLFARVAEASSPFELALEQYFNGVEDPLTLQLLNAERGAAGA
jgi:uncharacterized protein (DUF1810 family)